MRTCPRGLANRPVGHPETGLLLGIALGPQPLAPWPLWPPRSPLCRGQTLPTGDEAGLRLSPSASIL